MRRELDPFRCETNKHFPFYWQVVGNQCRSLSYPRGNLDEGVWIPSEKVDGVGSLALDDGIYCDVCIEIAVENGSVPVAESVDRARELFKNLVDDRPSRPGPSDIASLVSRLALHPNVVSHEHVDMVPRTFGPLPADFTGPLYDALRDRFEDGLYPHQIEALEAARLGHDVVQVTPTASGKTVGLLYPIVEAALVGRKSIVVTPRLVLAAQYIDELTATCDQCDEVAPQVVELSFGSSRVTVGRFDSATPEPSREIIQKQADIVITNELMAKLHFLDHDEGGHEGWRLFLGQVDFVVIDELDCHSGHKQTKYEPVQRALIEVVSALSSKRPQVLAASATSVETSEWHFRVTGGSNPLTIVNAGCGQSERDLFVVSPAAGQTSLEHAATLLTDLTLANNGLAPMSLVFETSPSEVAKAHDAIASAFAAAGLGSEVRKIRRYTGNTPDEERREIEASIMSRQTRVTVANEALGVGADLGTLEVAIFVGSPLTAGKAKQYLGRVGRRHRSIVVFVLDDSPLSVSLQTGRPPLTVLDEITRRSAMPMVAEHVDAQCLRPLLGCLGEIPRCVVDALPKALLSDLKGRLGLYRGSGRTLSPRNDSPRTVSLFDDDNIKYFASCDSIGLVPIPVADGRRSNVSGAEFVLRGSWVRVVSTHRGRLNRSKHDPKFGFRLNVELISEPSGWHAASRYVTEDVAEVKAVSVGGMKVSFGCGKVALTFSVTNPSGPRRSPPPVWISDASVVQFWAGVRRPSADVFSEIRALAFELGVPHLDFHLELCDDGSILMFDKNQMGRMAWFVAQEYVNQISLLDSSQEAA